MTLQFRGANLAGAGATAPWSTWGSSGPVDGKDYLFVSQADVDGMLAKGANSFRLLFTWEALQPAERADITQLAGNYAKYRDTLFARIDYILSKGAHVILDIHGGADAGFAGYKGVVVGTKTANGSDVGDLLANLWGQIAARYRNQPAIEYGITNEPHDIPAVTWFAAAQKCILAIRTAGATGTIWAPGVGWTSAETWATKNGPYWNLMDPLKNLGFQVHLYFDQNDGGGATDIVSVNVGVDRMKGAIAWARSKGLRLFLAEVGLSASNALAAGAWKNLATLLNANSDVVAGFTWWAAGPPAWWSAYQFTLCPSGGKDSPQMALIAADLAGPLAPPAPVPPAPVDPTIALNAQITSLTTQLSAATAQRDAARLDLAAAQKQASMLQGIVDAVRTALAGA